MTSETLLDLLEDLASQYPVEISKERILGLVASVATNRLTDAQIVTAVNRCRDELRFFPLAVEFLERARAVTSDHDISGEAHKVFDALKANTGCRLGWIDPATGTHWDPAKVAKHLGPAAAKAFDCIGGDATFKTMDERSEKFERLAFVKAYRVLTADISRKQISDADVVAEIANRSVRRIEGDEL